MKQMNQAGLTGHRHTAGGGGVTSEDRSQDVERPWASWATVWMQWKVGSPGACLQGKISGQGLNRILSWMKILKT